MLADGTGFQRCSVVLQKASELRWAGRFGALAGAHRKGFVDIDFPAIVVGAGDYGGGTGFCLHVWRGERKEGRDYGTCHQGELQVFSHSRVRIITKTSTDHQRDELQRGRKDPRLPTRNLTENPKTRVGQL